MKHSQFFSFLVLTILGLTAFALPLVAAPTSAPLSGTLGASPTTGTLGGGTTSGTISSGTGSSTGSGIANASVAKAKVLGRKRWFPSARSPGLYEIRLPNTPTGFIERFLLQIPTNPVGPETPLLVAFHRFGNSMYDIAVNTQLCAEAEARGWILLAPISLTDEHLNSVPSQMNTEQLLDLITAVYEIDDDRIYGIGHSMGGGIALSYAARHLDPEKPMFASLINHTGVMSQAHSYDNDCFSPSGCSLQDDWEMWYGGSPTSNEFDFQRTSLIEIPYVTGFPSVPSVNQQTDMARNLTHIPMQSWLATGDPLQELVNQNYAFHQQMLIRGGDHTLVTKDLDVHSWDTLDYSAVLDFMSLQTLTLPTSAKTLADRNGTYFHFGVTQTVDRAFSPFTWNVDSAMNSLSLTETANLSIIDVDTNGAGLSAASGLTVNIDTADGNAPLIRLNGVQSQPLTAKLDGVAQRAGWTYDSSYGSIEIQNPDGNAHQWTFTF